MGDERKTVDPLRIPNYAARRSFLIHGFEITQATEVNTKIHFAFEAMKLFPFKRMLFQFWRLITDDEDNGRQLLETRHNVYAVSPYNRPLREIYRATCVKYQYSIIQEGDHNNDPAPWIISGGPFATAFLNRFPEVVLDRKGYSPLAVSALECELRCCVIVPVFSSRSSDCLGVIECSMKHPGFLLPVFNELRRELEMVGLSIYHVQGTWPYKTISGDLDAAKVEIEKALKIASESHTLTLAQVWIQGESDHRLVKLSRYSIGSDDDDPLSSIKDFYDKFTVISLKPGEGLAWRTLQTHQPHLCRNLYKLRDDSGVLALLSANASSKCASFVMCLRSSHTGDLDYLFEFFWPCKRDHLIILQTLLMTLRSFLPSFNLKQLGDDLSVVSLVTPRKVVLGNQLSEAPKALNEPSTSAGEKRKFSDVYPGQSDLNESDQYHLTSINILEGEDDDGEDDNDLTILATTRHETALVHLSSLSTFENVLEKLKKAFELDPAGSYTVKYEVSPGQWSNLACLERCQIREDKGLVKLRVLSNVKEASWHWKTNS
ncbi:hypothetical protein M8C21_006908 [Ambrosia artemisiifolia]|uniref:NLP1-9 GAF domain-containing protein n=1 Tax=Ambrosia artemisiifolia TaxID=4212 RepID=A0AAD5BYI1_AMBAR|nr:hypothetical protein M8C21_006908 [Ambrosia artemisiifolia]